MVIAAADWGGSRPAADLAALLVERGLGGDAVDLDDRLDRYRRDGSARSAEMRRLASSWAGAAARGSAAGRAAREFGTGGLLALAFPDRIARQRGAPGDYVLANGRGATLEPHLALARQTFIVVADLSGSAASSRILSAAAITLAEIEHISGDRGERRGRDHLRPRRAGASGPIGPAARRGGA